MSKWSCDTSCWVSSLITPVFIPQTKYTEQCSASQAGSRGVSGHWGEKCWSQLMVRVERGNTDTGAALRVPVATADCSQWRPAESGLGVITTSVSGEHSSVLSAYWQTPVNEIWSGSLSLEVRIEDTSWKTFANCLLPRPLRLKTIRETRTVWILVSWGSDSFSVKKACLQLDPSIDKASSSLTLTLNIGKEKWFKRSRIKHGGKQWWS